MIFDKQLLNITTFLTMYTKFSFRFIIFSNFLNKKRNFSKKIETIFIIVLTITYFFSKQSYFWLIFFVIVEICDEFDDNNVVFCEFLFFKKFVWKSCETNLRFKLIFVSTLFRYRSKFRCRQFFLTSWYFLF